MSADKQDRSITEKVTVSGNQVVDYEKTSLPRVMYAVGSFASQTTKFC